jgi:spore coat polysaccharide biosynthesis protein SpsF
MSRIDGVTAVRSSISEFSSQSSFDLVMTIGVLIHLAPDDLPSIYRRIEQLSERYVLIAEYFNPSPVTIDYRGHSDKLFKRDFAGEFIDTCEGEWKTVRSGFLWSRQYPAWDDLTWFLLEKANDND